MSQFAALANALHVLLTPEVIVLLLIGTILGLVLGVLPGLGGSVALAVLIPLTFGTDPLTAFALLVSATGGVAFGGSVTAILLNTPGTATNAATLLDGYPMARQGRAAEAIGASAMASGLGAVFGIVVLFLMIPFILPILLLFGPAEVFWLGVLGLTAIAVIVQGDVLSGLISSGIGFLVALHGLNRMTTTVRWDYDMFWLFDGFGILPPLIGLFAIAEMVHLGSKGESISGEILEVAGDKRKGAMSVFKHKWLFLRSSIIGTLVGMVPGVGGVAANYLAYANAVQTSKNSESFGTGDIRGVIASEASNDAKDGGSLLPTLAFAIPGSVTTAILLGAFVLHGITPGPLLLQNHMDLVFVILLSLLFSNVITSILGYSFAEWLSKIVTIQIHIVAAVIIVIAFMGTYSLANNIYNLVITLVFGVFGYTMIRIRMSRVPLIIALILAPIIEENYFRALQVSGGEYGIFVESPVAIVLIFLSILSLISPIIITWIQSGGHV